MRKFGLIGYPLSHSFSKKFFTQKFSAEGIEDCVYELYPIEDITLLPELISNDPELEGLNVTIPYKLDVMPYLNEIEGAALEIGAVNCISVNRDAGGLHLDGHNTDAYGFETSLLPLLEPHHTKALIFGDGGAAKAVKYVLNQQRIEFLSVTRKVMPGTITYDEVTPDILGVYTLLINTTPLGMSPDLESFPLIPYEALSERHLAYDLVYNPEETRFLEMARKQQAKIKNGLEMLHLQAERSWHIWNR
ncbi:shikimate dehydrogenase [Pedobacter sp. JY14-1]|uniref:shikimate dehydrogenase family protein n=1 Tax=Pedobacter sp. JY14-1 TaxID=3034151 RepID=UPI0023E25C8C|nr:shikimate dehydrogenase [Pedobacter sp. JY14-1]